MHRWRLHSLAEAEDNPLKHFADQIGQKEGRAEIFIRRRSISQTLMQSESHATSKADEKLICEQTNITVIVARGTVTSTSTFNTSVNRRYYQGGLSLKPPWILSSGASLAWKFQPLMDATSSSLKAGWRSFGSLPTIITLKTIGHFVHSASLPERDVVLLLLGDDALFCRRRGWLRWRGEQRGITLFFLTACSMPFCVSNRKSVCQVFEESLRRGYVENVEMPFTNCNPRHMWGPPSPGLQIRKACLPTLIQDHLYGTIKVYRMSYSVCHGHNFAFTRLGSL